MDFVSPVRVLFLCLELCGVRERCGARHGTRSFHKGGDYPKPVTKNGQIHNLAFQDTWASSQPLPDLMLLIVEPSPLRSSTLVKLNDNGWGLCHAELPDYMKVYFNLKLC